jgi:DNA helicase-2/ATP-dependent DNA helicase PcrA
MSPEVLTPTAPGPKDGDSSAAQGLDHASDSDLAAVHPALLGAFPQIRDNAAQARAVGQSEGPLLIIAGPGSGKTQVLVWRTLNLLMQGKAEPDEIVVCTFTEKAAFELRDRISSAARQAGAAFDLSDLVVGTIHGICNRFLLKYRHRTRLQAGYDTLDDLTQQLFLNDHFSGVFGEADAAGKYLGRWSTKWGAIANLVPYLNKITEELIDPGRLTGSLDEFTAAVGRAYVAYVEQLHAANAVDFAHLQTEFLRLLDLPEVGEAIAGRIKYVMVDEYQDTNFVQEELVLRLARPQLNVAVVGDEDQALYRFRGATVRNILEFPTRFEACSRETLSINYRSHERIIRAYNRWMASADWQNPNGPDFRFPKTIQAEPGAPYPAYPAVFSIYGTAARDEGERFADLVTFLRDNGIIEDYSQVALLLHSVRSDHSGKYLDALARRGIPAFCPRARGYFESEEVRLMVAALALILGYHGEGRGKLSGHALNELASYIDASLIDLAKVATGTPLAARLRALAAEVADLGEGQSLDRRVADYFYVLVADEPFATYLKDESRARNLAILSQLLNTFQAYYHFTVITYANREWLRRQFFNSFLRLLHEGGINEYEDPDQPFPKGYVQVMTIHQAKGLEFPVVAVGSLHVATSTSKGVDRVLGPFYHRPPFEPESRITDFDRMRLHYVAFSRAAKVLALTSAERPKPWFASIWDGLPQWPYVEKDLLTVLSFKLRERIPLKRTYSFTGDLKVYETCPRQYEYFRYYDFTPSRSAVIFFGLLVHQTIEDVHRWVLDGRLDEITDDVVRGFFETNVRNLTRSDVRPVGYEAREAAFRQVLNYVHQNRDQMARVIDTEVDVSVEKPDYILTGKIDLLLGGDGKLELLDFKSQVRPDRDDAYLAAYVKQLHLYAHILEQRYGKRPERLLLYWTGEERRDDALMAFEYDPGKVAAAGRHFDTVVDAISRREFAVRKAPEPKICKECDFKTYCFRQGTIKRVEG